MIITGTVFGGQVSARMVRLYDALETGKLSIALLAPRNQELKERHDKLQGQKSEFQMIMTNEKADVATQREVAKCAADFKELLQEGYLAEKKAFVSSFVNEVRVTGEHVLVNYRLPIPLPKASAENAPVLDIVHYGGDRVIRTPDLCDASAALSQLSYIPTNSILSILQTMGQFDRDPQQSFVALTGLVPKCISCTSTTRWYRARPYII